MQIKTTVGYHLTSFNMLPKGQKRKMLGSVEENEPLYINAGNRNWDGHYGKQHSSFLKKLKIELDKSHKSLVRGIPKGNKISILN